MAKIRENIEEIELGKIRREWDKERGKYYFSIVDVIGMATDSTDPRNYWKVLKNRLKNTQNKLVTECNQLKMRSNDGKLYLTDTLDSFMMIQLIKLISPKNASVFSKYFDGLEHKEKDSYPQGEYELLIDGYETNDSIVVMAMVADISVKNILISVTDKILTIRGERMEPKDVPQENYLYKELCWGTFYRSIILPSEVETENVSALCQHGLLSIEFKKIDKSIKRFIDVKYL